MIQPDLMEPDGNDGRGRRGPWVWALVLAPLMVLALITLDVEVPATLTGWSGRAAALAPYSALMGAFVLALAALLWGDHRARLAARRVVRAERRAQHLAARAERAEGLLAAEPGLLLLWDAEAGPEDPPRMLGRVSGVLAGHGDDSLAALLAALRLGDGERLAAAIRLLREQGASFSLALRGIDGALFEAEGRPTVGQAVVWLRDGSSERHEIERLSGLLADGQADAEVAESILNALPLALWRRDQKLDLVWCNQRYAEAVDAEGPEEVLARQAELDQGGRHLAQRARRERALIAESRAVVARGERRIMTFAEMPVAGGSVGYAQDETPLDDLRQELERHVAANRDTLDELRTAVAIFGADKALRFFNKAYTELWGLDRDWLATAPKEGEILEHLREARLLPEQANFPAWKRRRLALYNKVIDQPEELWHLPDGRTLRVVCRAHPQGGLVTLYDDVTDRLQLESSHKLLIGVQRTTLDNLYEGIALFGSDGRLKLVNPAFARIWTLDPAALAGEPHFAAVAEHCRGRLDDAREWERLAGRVTSLDPERAAWTGRFERRDGAVVDYAGIPLPDGATLLSFLDVTDTIHMERALRERNDALEAADRIKSDFVSHVSYQLRTPLNTIIGFSTMLDRAMLSEPLTPKQGEYVGNILEASDQLLRLIDDILDLATIEAGRMTLDLGEMDVRRALEAAVGLAAKRAQESRLALELVIDPSVGRIQADERRIKQVVFNLLQNAVAFTPPGGRIVVSAARSGSDVRIGVADTGQGIAPRVQATVFDRFESRGSEGRRGAGLGLSLVKSFVQLHGGWVELQSAPGKGTTVTCHLPDTAYLEPRERQDAAE